jgi:hypothetical protein
MPYARRNATGRIVALSEQRSAPEDEELPPDHPELLEFVRSIEVDQLAGTDRAFIRVLEDLIELLIARGAIRFTDLPAAAQEKMLHRQQLRDRLRPHLDLLDEEGEELL